MITENIPLQNISTLETESKSISLTLARLDQLHPHYGGNKWFKLKYNLADAKAKGYKKILTFGGAYSNHIYATAAACADEGIECIGVIRGEENLPLNETLQFATQKGMKLIYLSRSDYKNKNEIIIDKLKNSLTDFYIIPEGGANANGIIGCAEITSLLPDFNYIICACGTFTTMAGLTLSLNENQKAVGVSVLKADGIGAKSLLELNTITGNELNLSINNKLQQVEIFENYHFGGYAKTNNELESFIKSFYDKYQIHLDHVYTGKMMYAVFDLIKKKYFPPGSKIIVLMSGRGVWNK